MEKFTPVLYNYFKGLEMGDTVMILESFAVNAMIHSPLYGDVPAKNFTQNSLTIPDNQTLPC